MLEIKQRTKPSFYIKILYNLVVALTCLLKFNVEIPVRRWKKKTKGLGQIEKLNFMQYSIVKVQVGEEREFFCPL